MDNPNVVVLMAVRNAARFLKEQLDSIFNQEECKNLSLWVSDDGSDDETIAILEEYKKTHNNNQITIVPGPQKGFAENFMSFIVAHNIDADFYAFSDQDDIWERDKLKRALAQLKTADYDQPALYGSRTRLVDENNNEFGFSTLFSRPPCFQNALVHSIMGGNTMVFNRSAYQVLKKVSQNVEFVSHDWWLYIVISGIGGKVFYDPYPGLRYRQHGANQVGSNRGFFSKIARLFMLFTGRFRRSNDVQVKAIRQMRALLTPENQRVFDLFDHARKRWLLPRMMGLYRAKVHRQRPAEHAIFMLAAIFKEV